MTPSHIALEQKVAALCRPETYPEAPPHLEVIETHMSFVFLTPSHAYKLKKPVRYDSLDFSTLALRHHFCREELRLNAPLAPDVYLAVVPVKRRPNGRIDLTADGEVIEWLVQMRRLPREEMLDARIRTGRLQAGEIDPLAERLAGFYAQAAPEPVSFEARQAYLLQELDHDRATFAPHATELGGDDLQTLHHAQRAFVVGREALLQQRVADQRFVEGHGDLRPEHVCLLAPPVVFDRIEFNRGLRIVDPVYELAHLGMECERLGASWIGTQLLGHYTGRTGDRPPRELVDFYRSLAASLRARLAVLHTRELEPARWERWLAKGRSYLGLASRYAIAAIA
jgi:aminoglycoside phosphotransferase family enzyme